jgi:hypothetical protein
MKREAGRNDANDHDSSFDDLEEIEKAPLRVTKRARTRLPEELRWVAAEIANGVA